MQHRTLGKSTIKITPIIFGGWQAGKSGWVGIDDDESIAAHNAAFDAGITTFDTAEWYGDGHSEKILGKALGTKREQIQILTKVAPHHLQAEEVIEACDRSLTNLGTDYIDLYQIHWPSKTVPIAETMSALNSLKDAGKIRSIGVSNFSLQQLIEATALGRIDSIQPPYNLFWTRAAEEVTPYCVENAISILAYSPLAQGLLTGRFGKDVWFSDSDIRKKNKLLSGPNLNRALDALRRLGPIADKYNATLGQLALAWLIAQPQTSAVVGARKAEQAIQNAAAVNFELDPDDIIDIDAMGKRVTDHLDADPVMWTS
jgi:aryl-alcohol dehydrogenase-like predicted oxidoreductase